MSEAGLGINGVPRRGLVFPQVFGVLRNPCPCFPLHLQGTDVPHSALFQVYCAVCVTQSLYSLMLPAANTPKSLSKKLSSSLVLWAALPCWKANVQTGEPPPAHPAHHGRELGKEQSQRYWYSSSSLPCTFQVTLNLELLQDFACVPWRQGVHSAGSST